MEVGVESRLTSGCRRGWDGRGRYSCRKRLRGTAHEEAAGGGSWLMNRGKRLTWQKRVRQ